MKFTAGILVQLHTLLWKYLLSPKSWSVFSMKIIHVYHGFAWGKQINLWSMADIMLQVATATISLFFLDTWVTHLLTMWSTLANEGKAGSGACPSRLGFQNLYHNLFFIHHDLGHVWPWQLSYRRNHLGSKYDLKESSTRTPPPSSRELLTMSVNRNYLLLLFKPQRFWKNNVYQ